MPGRTFFRDSAIRSEDGAGANNASQEDAFASEAERIKREKLEPTGSLHVNVIGRPEKTRWEGSAQLVEESRQVLHSSRRVLAKSRQLEIDAIALLEELGRCGPPKP